MASLIQWLKFCGARDTSGAPVASGFAYFYVPGAPGTFITVYQDAAGSTPYTADTPVPLNAAGQAEVYIQDPCEILIKDAAGVTKQDVEWATPLDGALVRLDSDYFDGPLTVNDGFDRLGASIGQNGQYKESDNAVARKVSDALRSCICPADFGALGNGSADDTSPLQLAINRAIALKIPLRLDGGTYKVTSGLTVTGLLDVFGAGQGRSVINATSESFDVLTIATGSTTNGCSFRDFSVTATYTSGLGYSAVLCQSPLCSFENMVLAGGIGLELIGANCSARNLDITVKGSSGHYGQGIVFSAGSSATGCRVTAIKPSSSPQYSYGFTLTGDGAKAIGCSATDAQVGFYLMGGTDAMNLAIECSAITCDKGYSFNGARCGAVGCGAASSVTAAFEDNDGYGHVDAGNTWANDGGVAYMSSGTGIISVAFDPTKTTNVFAWTYSGTSGHITFTWPSPAPPMPAGKRYTLIIQCSASSLNDTPTTFPTQIKQVGLPNTLDTASTYTADFIATAAGVLAQATAWLEVHQTTW